MLIPVMLIIAILLFTIWLLSKPAKPNEFNIPITPDYCKGCRYNCRNRDLSPCEVCDKGDEWVQSMLIDQEDFDG